MRDPQWVLFDLNGTLLDPRPVARALPIADATPIVLAALQDGRAWMVDTLSGAYRPFLGYIHGALQRQARLAGADLDGTALEAVVSLMAQMPPFADSSDAIALLRGLWASTSAKRSPTVPGTLALEALESAGLGAQIERVIASDGVRAYKPATSVYRTAVEQLGVRPSEIVLVSAHWWDVTGAKACRGYAARGSRRRSGFLMPGTLTPDLQGASLRAVARAIADAIRPADG